MKKMLAVFALALASVAWGQDKPAAAAPSLALTAEEKLAVRNAQVEFLQAQTAFQQANQQAQAAQKQYTTAQQTLQQTVDALYTSRKLDKKNYALCEAPSPGVCEKAPVHDLTLQGIAQPADAKPEEKK